jgi:hypothetical protein
MKKLTEFIEKNVQWLVLGLGVCYLLYMAWAYLVFPPVKVTGIGPEPLSPGDIDQHIYNDIAAPLEGKMKEGKPPKIEVPNFVAQFGADMDKHDAAPLEQFTLNLPPSTSADLQPPGPPNQPNQPNRPVNPNQPVKDAITELPKLAAAKLNGLKSGMSNVLQPTQPDAAPVDPNNGAAAAISNVDKSWVTVRYEIDPKQLVAEWDRLKIPQGTVNTTFLQVVLERQELQPDSTWSDPTPVPTLALQQQQQPPPPQFPAENAAPQDMWLYLQWASSHQVDVLQPPFYQVAKGDVWTIPGEAAPVNPQQQQFDPNQYLDAPINELLKLTPDQRRLVQQAKQKRDAEKAKGARPSRGNTGPRGPVGPYGPGGAGGGGAGGVPEMGPNDQGRPPGAPGPYGGGRPPMGMGPAGYGGARGPAYGPGGYGPQPGYDPEMEGEGGVVQPPPSANFPIPTTEFDPHVWAKANPDKPIVGWAHDETVVPGHTYRYRVTYKMKNPIFFAANVAKDPKLTQVFAIASKPTEWSEQVEVRSTIVFYIARSGNANRVPIQVFRWQTGEPKTETFDVVPGDAVGLKKGDIDYNTGWTLVDIRNEDGYILLMDPSGTMHRRNVKDDMSDPNFKQLKEQTSAANASASAATPGALPPGR